MIINNQESNIQVIGDITEFKSSIDPKNLEFITTLLSSNLYSAPERSFIREIVSNAWDSQVEANTTDIPIIIKIKEEKEIVKTYGSSYEEWSGIGDITIRDFGTGLSPERFNDIYRNIGSSTKRESNDYHGAFGIGHLSGFSCSNTMYITSYHNNTCYEYIGIKDANSIVYTLVSTYPTTEKNGLEVTLKNVNLEKYRRAIKYISFFPNVFVDDNNPPYYQQTNNIKIKKYKNFWVSSYVYDDKLLLGNVLYPLNSNELRVNDDNLKDVRNFIIHIKNTGIVLKFDIGELPVTPNRESIIYTKECINVIINKIRKANNEIDKIIEEKSKIDYNDIFEYREFISLSKGFDFFKDDIINNNAFVYEVDIRKLCVTYKGKDLSLYRDVIYGLSYDLTYYAKCFVENSVYNVGTGMPVRCRSKCKVNKIGNRILILKKDIKFNKYIKGYLLQNYSDYIVLNSLSLAKVKEVAMRYTDVASYSNTDIIDFIINEVYNYILNKGTLIDFENDKDFLEYKKICKEEYKKDKKSTLTNQEIVITTYERSHNGRILKFNNIQETVAYLKKQKRGIVFIDRDTTEIVKCIIIERGFLPVFVNKKIRNVLKEYNFSVDINWILYKDPKLTFVKTVKHVFGDASNLLAKLHQVNTIIPDRYKSIIDDMIHNKELIMNHYYCVFANKKEDIDKSLEESLLKIKDYITQYDKALDIIEESCLSTLYYQRTNDDRIIGLIAKIMVKNQNFVNYKAYAKSKHNKLIKILCKK